MPKAPFTSAMPCWNGVEPGILSRTRLKVRGPKATTVTAAVHQAGIQGGRRECDSRWASWGGEVASLSELAIPIPTMSRAPEPARSRGPIGRTR